MHLLFAIFLAFPVYAQKTDSHTAVEKALIRGDQYISSGIDYLADSLDLFLAGKRYVDTKNPTTVRITNSWYSREGQKPQNAWGLGVALRLPNLEKSWALRFTTYDENTEERGIRRNSLRTTPRTENYGTSVAFFRQLGTVKTTFRPRIELRDPLKISHMVRFDIRAEMKKFSINPRVELFATPGKGTGVFNSLNFEYEFSKIYTLSQINEFEYEDGRNLFTGDNGLSLGQVINDDLSLSYSVVVESSSRIRYHMDSYVVLASWRQALYRRVFEFQVTPYWAFPKSNHFKGIVGINASFSLIF